jgi:ribosomal protein L11 methyltransferase
MWQISMAVSSAAEQTAADLLERCFHQPPSIFCDARTGKSTVSVYLSSLRQSHRAIRRELGHCSKELQIPVTLRRPRVRIRKIRRENWAQSWKRHFKPIEIGRALLIKPSWSRRQARAGQRVVVLDPGLSFGTGHHATTAFCLEQLAACRRKNRRQSFLDIGAGSGILAIAAAKLGYAPVRAFDCDPQAIRVSRQNARQNNLHHRVRPQRQDLTRLPVWSRRKWDVICANLVWDLLISQAEKISARLHPDGHLILAGVLRRQFAQVQRSYANFGLTLDAHQVQSEWQSGRFVYRPVVMSGQHAGGKPG